MASHFWEVLKMTKIVVERETAGTQMPLQICTLRDTVEKANGGMFLVA